MCFIDFKQNLFNSFELKLAEMMGINTYDFNGKTTTNVCEDVVKVLTKQHQCSLCDLLKALNHNAFCEKADVFISHAWKYPFLDVIAILEHHFKDNPNVIVWFDLFCNNQHQATEFEFDWWATTFLKLLLKILSIR